MGQVRIPAPIKFFCGLLMAPAVSQVEVELALEPAFGPVVLRSPRLPFTQTSYYEREMGSQLMRCYVAFEPNISPMSWKDYGRGRVRNGKSISIPAISIWPKSFWPRRKTTPIACILAPACMRK